MKTALYDQHLALGAKMVDFAGWEMPIQYSGIIQEHHAVRKQAGLFDVSHMGRIMVEGLQAEAFLDYLSTNLIAGKANGTATYTVLCNEAGGSVDDTIVYKIDATHFFLIANASNRQKDLDHLIKHSAGFDVTIQDRFADDAIIAVQGPAALEIVKPIFPEAEGLKTMHFAQGRYQGHDAIVSATGYTGAGGFELCVPNDVSIDLWKELLDKGRNKGLIPAGLGARDTLRLEMGYALYGHELSDDIHPAESVSRWTIKPHQHDFLGKERQQGRGRCEYGVVLQGKGIAREGCLVQKNGKPIGKVTSGTYSPTLQKAIAIIISDEALNLGDSVDVQIRANLCAATVVKLPFLAPAT